MNGGGELEVDESLKRGSEGDMTSLSIVDRWWSRRLWKFGCVDRKRWLWLWGLRGLNCNLPEDLLPLLAQHFSPSFLLNSFVVFRTDLDISHHLHRTSVGVQDTKATGARGMVIKILADAEEETSHSQFGKLPFSVLLQPIPGGCAKL